MLTDTGPMPPDDAVPEDVPPEDVPPEDVQCSAKGCRQDATSLIVWNNPKVHTPDREKTWVACAQHRQSLADHLDVRGFLTRVEPLTS